MKIAYTIQDPVNNFLSIEEIYTILDKYYDRVGTSPGVIYLSRTLYVCFIRSVGMMQVYSKPISRVPEVLHITTAYGTLPILCDFGSKTSEIMLDISPEFDKEFEKIVLGTNG